jgi:uncharacterized membrane-anchored protein YhcB (DUF1043 family)
MFGLFGQVKMVFTIIMLLGVAGGGAYVLKLRGDNAILKGNQVKMEQALETQTKFIEQQKKDYEAILKANQEVNKLVGNLKKDIDDLDKRFNKGTQRFGQDSNRKTRSIGKNSQQSVRQSIEMRGNSRWC